MHEVSIASSILEIAEARARDVNAFAIRAIGIRLGEFTSVVREALEFAFEAVREGTLAAHATLEIEYVPLVVRCVICDTAPARIAESRFYCMACGFPLEIVSGEEMQVEYIEVDREKEDL